MELFCIAFAADCSNSAMQAAAVYSYIKTYLTSAEIATNVTTTYSIYGCEDMELFCIAFAADCILQCKRLQYIPTSKHT